MNRRYYSVFARSIRSIIGVGFVVVAMSPGSALAQAEDRPQPDSSVAGRNVRTLCGTPIAPPSNLPPTDVGPVVYTLELCFPQQGNVSMIEPQTYLYYINLLPSRPSQNDWVSYDALAEETMIDDFQRLWDTNFLEDLSVEISDYVFENGVVGKLVTYQMEERERIKIVDYAGSDEIDRTKIDEKLRELDISLRLDSFRDDSAIRRVESVLRSYMADKGYANAEVTHTITPVGGGPKLISVNFHITDGPKIKIREVEFVGNVAVSDGDLRKQLKRNRPRGLWLISFITRRGTYNPEGIEEDAERVTQYYRNRGYIDARIGSPELLTLEDSEDGKTRWIQLRIPVTEGRRYRIGSFKFGGNKVISGERLRTLFEVKEGEFYKEEEFRDGLEKAREVYGAAGYWEFTGYPDTQKPNSGVGSSPGQVPTILAAKLPPQDPIVDVTMRVQEGEQYFVNRITFIGNTTTRDKVIRREMQVAEGGVFNTESLKSSLRRINQFGFFKQLEEQDAIDVQKTPDKDNFVDLTLTLDEENRNSITFGAGVSQFEGFFGQLGFQTSNFLGRGETLNLSAQAGSRAQNYQVGFTEPYLFDRNMTLGFDLFKRRIDYISQFTQSSMGGGITFGVPLGVFTRVYVMYRYEATQVEDLTEAFFDPSCWYSSVGCAEISISDPTSMNIDQLAMLQRNPFISDTLLIGQQGRRTVSKIQPSFIHNTVDNPIFPNTGTKLTLSLDLAGMGGNTSFYKPRVEFVKFFRHTRRTSIGLRTQFEYIHPFGDTQTLPIFEKLFLGGEYSIRGFDIRSVGPRDPSSPIVIGGNKSLLFNAEYLISITDQVRLVLFYDTGQVVDEGVSFATEHFRTSTGIEVRFFMPVINIPFRLIFAKNPQRGDVLDNNLRPQQDFSFKFAVGSTF